MSTQHTPTAIYKEPELFYEAKIREEILKRYNIAFEVFMAEQYSRIHYSELMDSSTDEPLTSKQRLISWINEQWYWQAVAVLGAKLLEYLYDMNALQTDIAKAYVRQIKLSRQLLKSIGKITGRVAKNYGENYSYDNIEEVKEAILAIKQSIEETFKQQIKMSYEIFKSQREYQIYLAYRKIIKNDILKIYREELKLPESSFSVQENKLNRLEERCLN